MKFVTIDFETANRSRNSVCSLGMVKVDDGVIIDRWYSLICPPVLKFDAINISIHGITAKDVRNEPSFDKRWPEISSFIRGYTVIAHNAGFDFSVLRNILDTYNIEYPELEYYCTVICSKKTWPGRPQYSLDAMADFLGISFSHHHALEDAEAAATVLLKAAKEKNVASVDELNQILKTKLGRLYPGGYCAASISCPVSSKTGK